jgi:hypothetical protein
MFKSRNIYDFSRKALINTQKANFATRKFHSNFDTNLNWLKNSLIGKGMTIAKGLAGVNILLFLYVNLRMSKEGQFKALQGVSYSLRNFYNKDYIPLFASLLGSYRLDDLVLDSGIILTLGHGLEKLHGSPFMFKMFLFSFYIGFLSSLFWVKYNAAKTSRYHFENPLKTDYGAPNSQEYRFMSTHGFSMSLVYFFLYKNAKYRAAILPILLVDLYIWGPYYLSGAITGLGAGLIL